MVLLHLQSLLCHQATSQTVDLAIGAGIVRSRCSFGSQLRDIGGELCLEVQQYPKEELEADGKKVLRKIDRVMLPVICITCIMMQKLPVAKFTGGLLLGWAVVLV
ncbi:hypothetical protein IWX49DRAFT_277982 [Phyllosticta citricarpa]